MTETTDRYAFPLLQVAQAQKEVTHNEAIAGIDALLQLSVETLSLAIPPLSPAAGQAWIVAGAGGGAWAGRGGQLATFGAGWRFIAPREGCVAWLRDTQRFAVFTAAGWQSDAWPAAGLRVGGRLLLSTTPGAIAAPTGGTTVDSEVRAALAALLSTLRGQGLVA